MKVVLTTLNAKYIHKNLALRWIYVSRPPEIQTELLEFVIRDDLQRITDQIAALQPDLIGLSVYIWNAEQTKRWIRLLQQALPQVRILIGGPEPTYDPQPWLQLGIEAVLRGEGERTFWEAVLRKPEVDGLICNDYVSPVSYARTDLAWLETLPSPYWLQMDRPSMAHRYLYLETSRGCPYHCAYCLSSADNAVRMFSTEYIRRQLQPLKSLAVKQVKVLDRTFNVMPQRALAIARMIEERPPQVNFQFEIVADTLSEPLLEFFENQADPRRYRFEIGVQSLNPQTLAAVCRRQDNDRLFQVSRRLIRRGIHCHLDLIAGLPYEDLASFERSYNGLFALAPHELQTGILKLLKGTAMQQKAAQWQMRFEEQAPYAVKETAWLSAAQVQRIEKVALATEKIFNQGRGRQCVVTFLNEHPEISPFELMEALGRRLAQLSHPYQLKDLYEQIWQELRGRIAEPEASARVNTDYQMISRKRPAMLATQHPDALTQRAIRQVLASRLAFDPQRVYNSTSVDLGWHRRQCRIQVIFRDTDQPKRIWLTMNDREVDIDEIDCDCLGQ